MRMLDSRRLTGPNLLWERPSAVLDVEFGDYQPDLVIGAWQNQARKLLDEVGWKDEDVCVRRFEGGASLALSAPPDALYAACEVNEAAWDAARDFIDGSNRHLLQRVARELRDEIRDEEQPRLQGLIEGARQRGIPYVVDADEFSLGLGVHSQCWDIAALPDAADLKWSVFSAIPLAIITGTNGKTTTVRLMASIGRAAGRVTGVSSTDWLAVGDDIVERDDYAGPQGARKILRDRRCELAILETARGGLLRRGLAVNHADAALITNIAADHIGEFGVQNLEELADVKWVVSRALGESGTLVLNADDPRLVARAPSARSTLYWFSLDPHNPVLKAHLADGGTGCTVEKNRIVLRQGKGRQSVIPIDRVPICFGGAARHNVANALAATALAHALDISLKAIRAGLSGLRTDDNPGRGNLYDINGVKVLLDFAHNPHGLSALIDMAGQMTARRRLLIIGQAGDRSDADIRDLARSAHNTRFDRVLIKRLDKYTRGRESGETARMLREEFRAQGYKAAELAEHTAELGALRAALRWAEAGDLILFLVHEDRQAALDLLDTLQSGE